MSSTTTSPDEKGTEADYTPSHRIDTTYLTVKDSTGGVSYDIISIDTTILKPIN